MEARIYRAICIAACFLSLGANYRTQHFLVTAPNQTLATEIGQYAEKYRRELAIEWLGRELPPWQDICPIRADVGQHLGAGGATSFAFNQQRPFGWTMSVQGSRERILDSVLPHEITHTIFATHFGQPLPRWADEGACTTVEHYSEIQKQEDHLINFLRTDRGIAFNKMFAMKEYPRDILPLYAQGHSVAKYLIAQGGKRKFLNFVGEGMQTNNWHVAIKNHYAYQDLSDLQLTWIAWVKNGRGPVVARNTSPAGIGTPVRTAAADLASVPARNAVATTVTDQGKPKAAGGSWYARQRDAAQGIVRGQNNSKDYANAPHKQAASQTLTRPQPIGRPQQIILEATRGDSYTPGSTNGAFLR